MDKPERHISRQELDRQRVRALQVDPVNNLLTDIAHESEPSLKYGRIVIRENEWPYDCYSCGVPFYEGDAALYRDTGEGEFSKTDPVDDSAFCSVDCIWTHYWSSPVFDPSKFVKGEGDGRPETPSRWASYIDGLGRSHSRMPPPLPEGGVRNELDHLNSLMSEFSHPGLGMVLSPQRFREAMILFKRAQQLMDDYFKEIDEQGEEE